MVDSAHRPGLGAAGLEASGAWCRTRSGFAAQPPTFIVDVRDWVPRKLAALRCHRTQMGADNPFARLDAADAQRCSASSSSAVRDRRQAVRCSNRCETSLVD